VGGNDHHAHVRVALAEPGKNVEAVRVRQPHVEKNHVRRLLEVGRKPCRPGGRHPDAETERLEVPLKGEADGLFVVDDQDGRGVLHARSL
jgi:hypothetical protein